MADVPIPLQPLPLESDYVRGQRQWGIALTQKVNETAAKLEGDINKIGANFVPKQFNATFANGGLIASSASLPTVILTGGTIFAGGGEVAKSDSSFTLESLTSYIYYSIDDEGTVSFTKDTEYIPDIWPKVPEEEMTANRLLFKVYKDSTGDFYILENIHPGGNLEMSNRWWNFVYPQETGSGVIVSDTSGGLTNPDFRFLSVPSTSGTYVLGCVDGIMTWLSTAACEDSPSV